MNKKYSFQNYNFPEKCLDSLEKEMNGCLVYFAGLADSFTTPGFLTLISFQWQLEIE